ncbi:MAG: CopG family transcriptional regulator [Acidobacteriota bacterium]
MRATVELPDAVLQQLESLASREGATAADLIRRLVESHLNQRQAASPGQSVHLPLIPESETGPLRPVTRAKVDEILSRDHLTS